MFLPHWQILILSKCIGTKIFDLFSGFLVFIRMCNYWIYFASIALCLPVEMKNRDAMHNDQNRVAGHSMLCFTFPFSDYKQHPCVIDVCFTPFMIKQGPSVIYGGRWTPMGSKVAVALLNHSSWGFSVLLRTHLGCGIEPVTLRLPELLSHCCLQSWWLQL